MAAEDIVLGAGEELDWRTVRGDFPVTEGTVYLNSAASGPVPRPVHAAATGFYAEMLEGGDRLWEEWLDRRERARESVARLINADPEEVAFTTNTSTGMNLIIDALEGHGEVVAGELEFPVSTITWMHRGARVRLVKAVGGELRADDLLGVAGDGDSVICLSHVQYSNGFRSDLEEIGRRKGRHPFVVNASQSAGAFQLDVKRMGIDALCTTGHKWMLSGYGSGFVYLSRELLARTRPRSIGWMSVENPYGMSNTEFVVRPDAAPRAEMGCPHFAGIFAIDAAARYFQRLGPERIERRVLALNSYLTERLADAGWRVLSPTAREGARSAETLVAMDEPRRTVAQLARRGVAVTLKPEGIRVATHFFNDETDIDRLIDALGEMKRS